MKLFGTSQLSIAHFHSPPNPALKQTTHQLQLLQIPVHLVLCGSPRGLQFWNSNLVLLLVYTNSSLLYLLVFCLLFFLGPSFTNVIPIQFWLRELSWRARANLLASTLSLKDWLLGSKSLPALNPFFAPFSHHSLASVYFFLVESELKLQVDIINYGFLTTETNSNALYIFHGFHHLISKAIFSDCTDLCLQINVYNVFQKKEQKTHKTFHIFSHFENKSTFWKRITFWKWEYIPKNIFEMKACFWKGEK